MCEGEYPENSLFRRCQKCDYDLCAACRCLAKRPGDKETEDEASPPPPPHGKPRSRRTREVKKDDDDESPPPPPPGKPPRSVKSSRNLLLNTLASTLSIRKLLMIFYIYFYFIFLFGYSLLSELLFFKYYNIKNLFIQLNNC